MQLLALDTSTDRMSVAVGRSIEGRQQVWSDEAEGGAQASSRLIPMVRAQMARAGLAFSELDAIVFGRGPGAFTGLRTACAVAQGLALGARTDAPGAPRSVPVLPLDSLMAVAEQARIAHGGLQQPWDVLAMLDARMDEVYWGSYRWHGSHWQVLAPPALARPREVPFVAGQVLAGNVFATYGDRLPAASAGAPQIAALPLASAMLGLAPTLLAQGQGVDAALALPLYIRDKVASTTAERAAAKAAEAQPAS
ncbi:MAG: tRNA (adenosine(37)-N6)-threonylcarbamoyltransferase complex dimerization subunit type 1 TsaB [Burkholderiaceae bacterium]|nr:tRNA (adenosine(37)-N6)-threonylcarbamoyltransferase complex dimerization subunit type 1 TsaB [Rhodoferax sp.]MCB2005678.1 tRNA (adenosine(37)-N6)-threonylcarbamoyltransferase complex dimerization subunit type 1 TsaB [Rhodoferax sp.]MCB2030559.1 tRNA (adenosine(37)-N6)-threonylcarbamoyltransferase complex dimerization subunit type 1 TsaB [Rhodoferax sp.]MCB2040798.1 tRNA (adenosine(37)-N6)-threonylcarbamoyltransferase complex dimerization subunit type 1 TsaB [Rhodoferax sp.]MCP5263556.1 tRNA